MATGVAGAAGLTAIPYVGWIIGIAAAYVDATYVYPELLGKGKDNARAPRMLDVPVGSNEAGAPRIWAIGARVRVPTHILWQDSKVRETTSSASKGGTDTALRRVYIDALVSLNDRRTVGLIHLIGNGKLILYSSRNIVTVTTSEMSVSYGMPGAIVSNTAYVQADSTQDPDFADTFQAGDVISLDGFVYTSGPTDLNDTYWIIEQIAGHTPGAPSYITLAPASGQTETGLSYTGGTPFSPASVARVDDAIVNDVDNTTLTDNLGAAGITLTVEQGTNDAADWRDIFYAGDIVRVRNLVVSGGGAAFDEQYEWRVTEVYQGAVRMVNGTAQATIPLTNWESKSSTELCTVEYVNPPNFSSGVFPSTYDPAFSFHKGSETQGVNSLLSAVEGSDVPAYRGVAFQALNQFYATQFGDQLPYSLEALIQPDQSLNWQEAARLILERSGVPSSFIDTSGLSTKPFKGMFFRGNVPTLSAMQPMLIAGQIIGQERNGTMVLFTADSADVVQVANGSVYSDLGVTVQGEERIDNKVVYEDEAQEDLPTSVGIRHQDPDNQYTSGFQHFGLRNPGGVDFENNREIDLTSMVLTRKEARNLATTVLRRSWINRRKYRMMLPAAYIDILENDLITLTTDSGEDILCRVVQRDLGADWRVSITALAEDVDVEVSGSPVQSGAGVVTPVVVTPASLRTIFIDAPAVTNAHNTIPEIGIAVCANNLGQNWSGANIYEAIDGGSYNQVASIGAQAAIATVDEDLTAQSPSEEYGTTTVTVRAQTVDVTFGYEGDTALEAATQAEAEAGKNWCVLWDGTDYEVAAFTTVTPLGDGAYTLGGWLRGLRGTGSTIRAAGTQLTMLWPSVDNVYRRQFPGSILPTSLEYKVIPFGQSIDDVAANPVTATWRNARPLPVRSVTKTIGSSPFDARLEVDAHWTREVLPLGTQPPHPMDEPFEAYRFDIYDPTGATLLRSKTLTAQGSGSTALRDKWVTYTAAEQTTDGYTPSGTETFWVDVVQIGQFGDSPSIKEEI